MPTPKEEIGFEHRGIGAVLAQNRLAVPINQREYSWEDEHVAELFSDFASAIDNNQGTYFLGTVVLTRGEGNLPEVSDGQQRLATTTILLAAIRDHFFWKGDTLRAGSIEQNFLKTTDLETTATVPKLKMNVDDNDFFTKAIISSPDSQDRKTDPKTESHRRIKAAAQKAADHIKDLIKPYSESGQTARLLEWVKFIQDGATVIILRVPDHLNAFVMFETLNDRGLKASQADLLKNHLLSLAGTEGRAEGQQKWARMLGTLDSLGQGDITVTYIHHLLITKYGPTKEREVFGKVKSTVNSQSRALEFLEELAESANDYAALFNSDHKKWNEYGTSTRKHITTINQHLRVLQIRPLMFAVAKHFSTTEAKLAFKLFVFWSVRFLIVGGRGGLLDRNYSVAAHLVGSGKVKTAAELASALSSILPSDELFEAAFSEARVSKGFLARYYLRALEMQRKGQPEPEFVPNDDEHAVNVEHILPENPGVNWPNIDAKTAAANYNRLGNMVIMQATKNSIIGNSKFDDKKPVLAASPFILTSGVAAATDWSVTEIEERQKALAVLAVKTWPLKT